MCNLGALSEKPYFKECKPPGRHISTNQICFCENLVMNYTYFLDYTGCLKKNVVSWKNSHNYPQTHPKCKCWGCIGKFRIFATTWALRFSKLKKKWLRKWNLKLPTPPPKLGRIICSQYTLINPLSHFFFNFENLSAYMVANNLNFPIHPQHLHFGWVWG